MTGDLRPSTRMNAEALALDSAFSHIEHTGKRAFLRAYAETGKKRRAAELAGIHPDTPYSDAWRFDKEFQEALEVARQMAGDLLEAEMWRRGVEGAKRYHFDRHGRALLHPDECDCGHHRKAHGERGGDSCRECGCEGFEGRPYFEEEKSDRLLEQLARSHLPGRYHDRLSVRSTVAKLDFSQLPDWAIARISKGEEPLAVLASGPPGGEATEEARTEVLEGWVSGGRSTDGPEGSVSERPEDGCAAGRELTGGSQEEDR